MIPWEDMGEPIVFSARRGDEELHVQVIGGMDHPSGNPQMMAVVLEVRLGPDLAPATQHDASHEELGNAA